MSDGNKSLENNQPLLPDSGERRQYETGAVRDIAKGKGRCDLLLDFGHALEAISQHCEAGAEKYEPRNWLKGIPIRDFIDSGTRHVLKAGRGDREEPHWISAAWNYLAAIETYYRVKKGLLPTKLMNDAPPMKSLDFYEQNPSEDVGILQSVPVEGNPKPGEAITYDPTSDKYEVFQPGTTPTVYLSGPMTGRAIDWAWRQEATLCFNGAGIQTLDPTRGKIPSKMSNAGLLYDDKSVAPLVGRDLDDIKSCNAVLIYFPYIPTRQSIGTFSEMGMAIALNKPVYFVAHPTTESSMLDHPFVERFAEFFGSDFTGMLLTITSRLVKRTDVD